MQDWTTRMQAVQSPIIPVVGELIRQHSGTISLGQGVVAYGPPPEAIAQISECLKYPHNHRYQSVQGISPLREAIAHKLQQENQLAVSATDQIMVTAGSNMGFNNALLAITQPGDKIILQTPYYFNHEMAIAMASCKAVCVPTDEHYQLQLDQIAAAITDRTRAIVTISPNNPTGVVYPPAHLQAVNELCRDRGLYHISDEAYEYFTYEQAEHVSPAIFDAKGKHTISLFSLSKAYGFASWRIGYMVIPAHLLEAVKKIQDTILICPPVISQYAALGALTAGRDYCQGKLGAIAQVRQQVLNALAELGEFCTIPPADGAFYFLLKVHTQRSAMSVVEQLIRAHKVAVIPGSTFGMDQACYLRVAYGVLQPKTVTEAMERLVTGVGQICNGISS